MTEKLTQTPSVGPDTRRRNAFLWGAAATLGLCAGAGVAWWRYQPHGPEEAATPELNAFWALSLQTPAGETLAMQGFRGKPLVLNFWATWCPPCVEELPLLDGFFRENGAKGWQVLGLAVDQPSAVRQFLQKTPVAFPIGMAGMEGTELSKSLGNRVGGLPFTVVLGADGSVIQRKIGQVTAQELRQWVGSI